MLKGEYTEYSIILSYLLSFTDQNVFVLLVLSPGSWVIIEWKIDLVEDNMAVFVSMF